MVEPKLHQFRGSEDNILEASIYESDVNADLPPVLLLHGGGQTRHSWAGAADRLATKGYQTFTIDARGHGDSEWVKSKNYTFEYYRDDLRAVVEQLTEFNPLPPISIGASMGGVSTMLAQQSIGSPSTFSAIVLVDITPRMTSTGVNKIIGFMAEKMSDGFASVEEAADAVASYLPDRKRPKSLDGLTKNLRQHKDGRWYWHWDPAFVNGPNNVMTGGENATELLSKAASEISVPTLLVRGGKSELVTKEAAEEFLELVPHANYVDVTDASHMVAGDKNDIFADAVLNFLNETSL